MSIRAIGGRVRPRLRLVLPCIAAIGLTTAAQSRAAQPQDGTPAAQPGAGETAGASGEDVGPPPRVADTSAMDSDVVAILEERIAAVEAAPNDAEKRRELALAYEANTIWTLAEVAYDQALELAPDDDQWRFRRGIVRYYNGDLDGSLADLRSAADAFKNTPVVQARLGDVLRLAGELEESEAAWRRAIAAESAQPQQIAYAASRVGLAEVLLDLDEPAEAKELTERALEIDPSYRHAHFIRGRALRALGETEEAAIALTLGQDSFASFPPDPHQMLLNDAMRGFSRKMMMIENLVEAKAIGEASARLDEILAERPNDHMVQNLAARVALRQGQREKARALLQKSLEISPEEPATLVEACLLELEEANLRLNQFGQYQAQVAQPGQPLPAEVEAVRAEGEGFAREAVEFGRRAAEAAPFVGRNRFWHGIAQRVLAGFELDPAQSGQMLRGALQTLEMAGKLGCSEPAFHQQMAGLYLQTGQTPQALRHAKLNLAANPLDPAALEAVIQVELMTGTPEGIKPYVARIETIGIERKDARLLQFAVQGYLTNDQYDEAERTLGHFEEVTAGNPQAAQFTASVRQHIAGKRAASGGDK